MRSKKQKHSIGDLVACMVKRDDGGVDYVIGHISHDYNISLGITWIDKPDHPPSPVSFQTATRLKQLLNDIMNDSVKESYV